MPWGPDKVEQAGRREAPRTVHVLLRKAGPRLTVQDYGGCKESGQGPLLVFPLQLLLRPLGDKIFKSSSFLMLLIFLLQVGTLSTDMPRSSPS